MGARERLGGVGDEGGDAWGDASLFMILTGGPGEVGGVRIRYSVTICGEAEMVAAVKEEKRKAGDEGVLRKGLVQKGAGLRKRCGGDDAVERFVIQKPSRVGALERRDGGVEAEC